MEDFVIDVKWTFVDDYIERDFCILLDKLENRSFIINKSMFDKYNFVNDTYLKQEICKHIAEKNYVPCNDIKFIKGCLRKLIDVSTFLL